jgi:diacylglycerol kinase
MIRKFLNGFWYAFKGLGYAFTTQLNFKIHTAIAAVVCILGYYADLTATEWSWVIVSIMLVMIVELINTAIEVLVDKISPEYDRQAGIIKDISAAAVLITALMALLIGLIIFIPKYF